MKKVLYGVFMAFFAVMTMGAIQSCTDDLTDVKGDLNQTKYDLDGLKQQVKDLEPRVGSLESAMQDVLQTKIPALQTAIQNNTNEIDALKGQVKTLGDALNLRCDSLNNRLSAAETQLAEMKAWMDVYGVWVKQLKDDKVIEGIEAKVDSLTPKVNELYEAVFGADGKPGLVEEVADLKDAFDALQSQVDVLTNRVNELITSLFIQATDSPVFGDFSLPIGVQNNMLFGYYFKNTAQAFNFPTPSQAQAYNAEPAGVTFSGTTEAIPAGYADANLGNLYLTINPVGHNVLVGKKFSLETSKGAAGRLPFELKVDPTDEELFFGSHHGVTRGADNGFYKAEVVIPAKNQAAFEAADVKVSDDLKSAVKAILQDRTKRTALNLVKAVWDQVNGTFPRYAVRADWTVTDTTGTEVPYSVLSKYDLGVATTQPLSFAFYYGQGQITGHRVPLVHNNFTNLWARVKNEVLSIDLNQYIDKALAGVDFNINLGTIKLSAPQNINVSLQDAKITVNIDPIEVKATRPIGDDIQTGAVIGTSTPARVEVTDFTNMETAMSTAITTAMDQAFQSSNESIKTQFAQISKSVNEQIESIVNKVVANVKSGLNGKIDGFVNKVDNKVEPWFQRLDKLVDLYNRAADKINAFLAAPNDYLQPCVFYKADGNMGLVSVVENDPTVFVNGGGEGFDLFPTTYTAELVAPCYKKYIECISVDGKTDGAAAVNSSSEYLAKVLPGGTYKIFIPTTAMKTGKVYGFVYQALDYYGKTSTRKFYIQVNK